jgi:hypothetical protein
MVDQFLPLQLSVLAPPEARRVQWPGELLMEQNHTISVYILI